MIDVGYIGWIVDEWLWRSDHSHTQADPASDAGQQTASDGRL